jgi:hypothetical protein
VDDEAEVRDGPQGPRRTVDLDRRCSSNCWIRPAQFFDEEAADSNASTLFEIE